MDKKLKRKYDEERKLRDKIAALTTQLESTQEQREALEKVELYKDFELANISIEEYRAIISKAVSSYLGKETKPDEKSRMQRTQKEHHPSEVTVSGLAKDDSRGLTKAVAKVSRTPGESQTKLTSDRKDKRHEA